MRTTSLMIAALVAMAGTCSGQTCDWNVADGNWNTPTNWNPQVVPDGPGESATIAIGGTYTVTMDMSPTIDWLDISNPDATLDLRGNVLTLLEAGGLVNDGTISNYSHSTIVGNNTNNGLITLKGSNWTLWLHGPTVTNNAMIIVNPQHSGYWANLAFAADTTLQGTGVVQLDHNIAFLSTAAGVTLTQALGHRIEGRGEVRAAMVNNGVVEANMPGTEMIANTDAKVNNHQMKASGGGVLRVRDTTIDQTGGGTLRAEDGSAVRLDDATIIGGTLDTVGTGYIEVRDGHSTLIGVTNLGPLNLLGGNRNTSVAGTGMTNNGHVVVNSNTSGYWANLYFTESGTLDGSGTVTLNTTPAYLDSAAEVVVTHGAEHTIDGRGYLRAGLINDGVVDANMPGTEMVADTHAKINNNLMQASGGGVLRVRDTTIDQTGGGTLLAEDGSAVRLDGATILGGTLDSAGTGIVEARDENNTLTGVTNDGRLDLIGGNRYTYVAGTGMTNNGTVIINSNSSGYWADLYFTETGTLDGTGTVTLHRANALLESAADATVTHGASHTIDGLGTLGAAMINEGVVDANNAGGELVADTYDKINNTLMKASGGGALRVESITLDQTGGGMVRAEEASVVRLDGATVIGGTLETAGTGAVECRDEHNTLNGVTNNGLLNLIGGNRYTYVTGTGLTNNGTIVVNSNHSGYWANLYIPETTTIDGAGTVTLTRGSAYLEAAADMTCTIGPDQTVGGVGTVTGTFVFHGSISPGFSVGSLNVQGTIGMAPDAALDIEISSTASHDQTTGSADYTLDGTVRVAFVDDYAPAFGDQFWIVNGGSVEGEFHTIEGPVLPGNLVYKVRYEPAAAVLVITCPADTNADAQVNTLDFLEYLNLWTAGDPDADWNGDGQVNTLDFLAYLNEWVAGC